MARVHYWSFLLNDEGQPIQDANVTIYLAGTSTPASIYTDEFGGAVLSTAPQLTTNSRGFFEFWIGDTDETYGYRRDQKFKISWSKVGISSGYIDWVDVFSNISEVDETDSVSLTKDKVVSNALAYGWEYHKNFDIRTAEHTLPVHGIEAVDEEDGEDSGNFTTEQERINKLISNKLAYQWDKHSDYDFSGSGVNAHPDPKNTTAHGIEAIDETDGTDGDKNKLVSNQLIHDLIQDNLAFTKTDGSRPFTDVVSGVTPTADDHLATKQYVDNSISSTSYSETIATASWSLSGSDYYYDINHGFGVDYPIVITWDINTKTVIHTLEIESISSNIIRIYIDDPLDISVRVTP